MVNFSSGKTHTVTDNEGREKEFQKLNWDLGFSRTKIITNSGATNPFGKSGVINLGPIDFNKVSKAPNKGYVEDKISFGNLKNKAISEWYNYRTRTHNIESKKNVYVIKLQDNRFMKMRILNYYCGKKDEDCRTMMCSRQQAACLTVEYVLAKNGTNQFPNNFFSPKLAHDIDLSTNIN